MSYLYIQVLLIFPHRMSEINNIYEIAIEEVSKEAPEELINTLKTYMNKIKDGNPHNTQTVLHCLPILNDTPKLLDLLVICYILNGGLLLKHELDAQEDDLDDNFLNELEKFEL
jgi:hypothetical protein